MLFMFIAFLELLQNEGALIMIELMLVWCLLVEDDELVCNERDKVLLFILVCKTFAIKLNFENLEPVYVVRIKVD